MRHAPHFASTLVESRRRLDTITVMDVTFQATNLMVYCLRLWQGGPPPASVIAWPAPIGIFPENDAESGR